ncbi:kinase-like protein [Gigaspora margarita]|uniref:Kinase-like protein n=1 Tax=Gigaspora margarita TaxID=4874 RepID=A0A8H4A5U0_GIGMA|nr:kinase-like protein [Gigaspora margarita]
MTQSIITDGISFVDSSYKLINEIKNIIINLKKSKKILEPIIYSSTEVIRALHYVKYEIESYFRQYEEDFNTYKISLEKIKEFVKGIENLEKSYHLFYPYKHVKAEYEKLMTEHKNCEKKLHAILIQIIMNKQESHQKGLKDINKILKTIPDNNKGQNIAQIEGIIQNLLERTVLDIGVPRINSSLLIDPPYIDKNQEIESNGNIVKKIYKRGVEVACEPLMMFKKNMSMLGELKRFNDNRNILKFHGLSFVNETDMLVFEWAGLGSLKKVYEKGKISWDLKIKIARDICQGLLFLNHNDIFHRDIRCENIMMTNYMEPKIANFHLAKHMLEVQVESGDYISNIVNWAAPEMMQKNVLYTQECELFSFVMLLSELAYQKIPYAKMTKEEIIETVTNNRRDCPDPPFYSLDFLNIQRKYLKIIKEGWIGKAENRIKMNDILLRLLEIDIELTKYKKKDLESANSFNQPSRQSSLLIENSFNNSPILTESRYER